MYIQAHGLDKLDNVSYYCCRYTLWQQCVLWDIYTCSYVFRDEGDGNTKTNGTVGIGCAGHSSTQFNRSGLFFNGQCSCQHTAVDKCETERDILVNKPRNFKAMFHSKHCSIVQRVLCYAPSALFTL